MKSGASVFIVALVALGLSWGGFVLAPAIQLGTQKQTAVLNSTDIYPVQRPGDATLGLQVYRASGCAQCHTTQVRQQGVAFDVVVTSLGKNRDAVFKAIDEIDESKKQDIEHLISLPGEVFVGVTKDEADAAANKISAAGGKVETHLRATGVDISRGWGMRQSVAADFLYDYPVQLGSLRVGPDLANVGARLPDANWQLQHLYAPQSVVKNSAMPPFRFLFEKKKIGGRSGIGVSPVQADWKSVPLQLPPELAPPAGYEIVPTEDAKNLVAYLLSLRADVPLYEAPFTPPTISTNAPAEKK